MFNLSKKTEYGVMALTYLSSIEKGTLASVGEISSAAAIPREHLAKILSELVKAGLAISQAGPAGGFRLARPASAMSLADILRALEKKAGLVDCTTGHDNCRLTDRCTIRMPMARVHRKVARVLEETKLEDLLTRHDV